MTICVKAVFLGGIESKLHSFGSFYFKRLFGSVSPLCLGINGTGTNVNCTTHTVFDPVRYTMLVAPRKPRLNSKSFCSVGGKVVSSQTVTVPRYQLRSCGSAVMRSEKVLQGSGAWTGKNNNGAHFLRHRSHQNSDVFMFLYWMLKIEPFGQFGKCWCLTLKLAAFWLFYSESRKHNVYTTTFAL